MWSIVGYLIPLKITRKRHALPSHPREEGGEAGITELGEVDTRLNGTELNNRITKHPQESQIEAC